MIIDMHTHVWATPDQLGRDVAEKLRASHAERWGQFDASPAAHEQAMSCVDGAVVIGFRSDHLGACIPNEYVAEFVAKDPRRRVGVAGIDPMSEDALDQVDTAIGLGLQGVAVSPSAQAFHPSHSAALRVYERCDGLGIPVIVTATEPLATDAVLEFQRPGQWDEVARCFPNLNIVIGGMGHPWVDETLVLLGKHQNVYADICGVASRSWQLYNALLSASAMGVMDKLLYGSGFPQDTPAKTIEALYSVNSYSHGTQMPSVPRAQIRAIVERDSLAALGIESEIAARITEQAPAEDHPPVIGQRPASISGPHHG